MQGGGAVLCLKGEKDMKRWKNILGTILFLAIGSALFVMTSYILRPTVKSFFRERLTGFYAEDKESLDIVGIGSSALYRYLSVPVLWEEQKMTGYLWATGSQSVFAAPYLIEEVEKTQSPKLYVVEVRQFLRTEDKEINQNRLRLVTDNMKYSANRAAMVWNLVPGWKERFNTLFDVIRYHDNWENVSEESFAYIFNERENAMKGWINVARNHPIEKPKTQSVAGELPVSETAEEALLSLIEKCREKNVEVLFIATPWQIDEKSQKQNNYIKRLVEEQGYQFLDGNLCADEIGIDYDVDFYNERHTNAIGARKFTVFLGEYIREHYDFAIEHSEKTEESWDAAVSENQKRYEESAAVIREKIEKRREK